MQKTCLAAGLLAKGELLLDVDNSAFPSDGLSPKQKDLPKGRSFRIKGELLLDVDNNAFPSVGQSPVGKGKEPAFQPALFRKE